MVPNLICIRQIRQLPSIMRPVYECHDAPTSGHRGREKNYLTVSRNFYWPRQYQFVRKYIRACEVCQWVKPSPSTRAHRQPLSFPAECWQSDLWTSSSDFPKTVTETMESLFSQIYLARWYILLQYQSRLRLRAAPVSLSTQYSNSMV